FLEYVFTVYDFGFVTFEDPIMYSLVEPTNTSSEDTRKTLTLSCEYGNVSCINSTNEILHELDITKYSINHASNLYDFLDKTYRAKKLIFSKINIDKLVKNFSYHIEVEKVLERSSNIINRLTRLVPNIKYNVPEHSNEYYTKWQKMTIYLFNMFQE